MATRNRLTANTVAEALLRSKSLEGRSRSAIRRRDRRGEADQGLVEGEERGLHARGFLSAGGACEEGFEGGRVSRDSQPAARHGLSFEALCLRQRAPQRLVWGPRGFWAPWLFVPQDGVEDGEEFTGRGDGDEHFGLAGVDEALAKGLEDRIVTAGGEACEKKGGAHGLAAAGDHGFALPLAGLAGERGEPGEACDPLAIEGSEFGQFGDERAGGDRPHARNGGEEVLLLAPC